MIIYRLLVLILYYSIVGSTSSSPDDVCIGMCHCYRDSVDCSSLDLTEIPTGIPNNTRVLILSDNDIEQVDSSRLIHFRFLHTLDLTNNLIRGIDGHFFKNIPFLRSLHLRKNRLPHIPNGLQYLDRLEKLDLRSNLISDITANQFSQLAAVRQVDLSRNLIAALPKPGILTSRIILERLDLASNSISELGTDIFSRFHNLISIRLSRNRLTSLAQYTFSRLPRLESIDLTKNHIQEVRYLAFNQLPSLKNVSMAKNDIYRLDDGMFYVCENLQRLNLSSNRVQSVTEGWMFGLTSLEVLDLSYNQIQSFYPSAWNHTPNLLWLSLHSNRILSLPSGSFRALRRLEELILSANSIDSLHKFALVGMNNLHRLDLSSNTLAVCVEDGAVLYNTSMPFLRSLRFKNNQLRVIPSRAFERFPALEELDITDNPIATIHPDAFEPLKLRRLIMNSSSILCDCQISWFSTWIFKLQLDKSTIVAKCSYPPPLQHLDVIAIDRSNLTCLDDSPRAKIVGQPADEMTSLVGERARFTCDVYGEGPLLIEWRVMENGQPRALVQDSTTFMSVNKTAIINGTRTLDGREFAAAELILDDVKMSDRLDYQCVGRNRFGSDFSRHGRLNVYERPTFSNTPTDMSIIAGQSAKFVCAAIGSPRPELKWAFDGGLFPAAEGRRLYVKPNDDHLYIMNVTIHDQGIYTCHAGNIAGQVQASARLRVYENTFRAELESRVQRAGESIVLECFVDLIPGAQRMIWKRDGVEIHRVYEDQRYQLLANDQIFMLTHTQFSDSGEYSCELWADEFQLARQAANVRIVNETEFNEQNSLIYQKATQLGRTIASKWADHNKMNTKTMVAIIIIGTLIFLGICTSIMCCIGKCITSSIRRRQDGQQPVFV